MFVSCTSNLWEQMFDFQRYIRFSQRLMLNLQGHQQNRISSLKTPYEVNLARFNCTCFSRSSGNKASSELMRVCVCVSLGTSSTTIASHEVFHPLDGAHQFRQLHSRWRENLPQETSYLFHLLCDLRRLSKPWSPPADITTSKIFRP